MRNEFTVVGERDRRWDIAYCPEIPGANGQGKTKTAVKSLRDAIALILEDRRKDGLRGRPDKLPPARVAKRIERVDVHCVVRALSSRPIV